MKINLTTATLFVIITTIIHNILQYYFISHNVSLNFTPAALFLIIVTIIQKKKVYCNVISHNYDLWFTILILQCDFKSHNCIFVTHNSDFKTCNCNFVSHNCDIIQNFDFINRSMALIATHMTISFIIFFKLYLTIKFLKSKVRDFSVKSNTSH